MNQKTAGFLLGDVFDSILGKVESTQLAML
jgi:hypothetical protein